MLMLFLNGIQDVFRLLLAYLQSQVDFQSARNLVVINKYLNNKQVLKVANENLSCTVSSVLIGRHVVGKILHGEKNL